MTSCQTVEFCVKTGSSLPGCCLQDNCAALSSLGWGHNTPWVCAVADALPSMFWGSLSLSQQRRACWLPSRLSFTILTTNIQQPWLCSHFMSEHIWSPVLYLLPAGTAPRCEESGDGNKLMAFSFSLLLPSVGGTDMICLDGSGSSPSGLVMLEADVPSKQSKEKIRTTRENSLTLSSDQKIILVRTSDFKLTSTLKWTFKQFRWF